MKKHGFKRLKDNFPENEFSAELAPDPFAIRLRRSLSHTDRFDLSLKSPDLDSSFKKSDILQNNEKNGENQS